MDFVEYGRSLLGVAIVLLVILASIETASSSDLPQGYTCEQVRAYVREYGRVVALIQAKLHGATREQIRQAKECLK